MARYYGRWEVQSVAQTDLKGKPLVDAQGQPLRTFYLKSVSPKDLKQIREAMTRVSGIIQNWGKELGWPTTETMLDVPHPLPQIGNDPRQYTLEKISRDIQTHLATRRNNGKPHDLTRSFINRHNWLVGAWIRANMELDTEVDINRFDKYLVDIVDPDSDNEWHRNELGSLFE